MRATRRSKLSDHRPETPLECSKTFYLQHARMLAYSRILVETKNRRTRDQRLHPPCRCAWLPTGTKNRGIGRQTQRVPNMMFGTRIGEKQPRAKTSPTYARELRSRSNQAAPGLGSSPTSAGIRITASRWRRGTRWRHHQAAQRRILVTKSKHC